MNESVWQEYQAYRQISTDVSQDDSANLPASTRSIINAGTGYGSLIQSGSSGGSFTGSGTGQKLQVKVESGTPEVICALNSYTTSFSQSDFVSGDFLYADVAAFQIGLQKTSGQVFIGSMHGVGTTSTTTQESDIGGFFEAMISDIAGYFGIPTSTLFYILNGTSGSLETQYDGEHSYMHVEFGYDQSVNFDSSSAFPFGFYITTNGRNTGNVSAYSYLTYGVYMYNAYFPVRTTTARVSDISVGP